MAKKNFFIQIADVFLQDKDAPYWYEVTILRRLLYTLFFLLVLHGLIQIISISYLRDFLLNSESGSLFIRISNLVLWAAITFILIILSYQYYRYVLSSKGKLDIVNIIYFYFLSVLFFGVIYNSVYLIDPGSFSYINPPLKINSFMSIDTINLLKLRGQFSLFSALQSVNASFYKIQVNSFWPSLFGWVQSLYTLSLIAIFITAYVNQNTQKAKHM